jgi:hypothetical protein
MKVKQIHLKENKIYEGLEKEILDFMPNAIIIFGSLSFFTDPKVMKSLSQINPEIAILGCSTAGEITNNGVFDETASLSFMKFEGDSKVNINTALYDGVNARECGSQLSKKIDKNSLKFSIVLGPGVNLNGSDLIRGIQDNLEDDIILTGGLAADAGNFKQTFIITNGLISDKHAGIMSFYGENIEVGFGSMGGWEVFGPSRKITKAKGNILFELDNKPALEIYKEYLGDKSSGLPAAGLLYPLSILDNDQSDTGVIRTILGIDEDEHSIILAGEVLENSMVKLMQARSENLISGAETAAKNCINFMKENQGEKLGILISCIGRKLVLEDEVDEEVEAVVNTFGPSVICGYYSNGEICPHNQVVQDCKLHNQTMTITLIGECGGV